MFDGVTAYECNGTPVDCVKIAKNVLLKETKVFLLCLSGINHGSNASINIIYSGTMSAAMASIEGIPSIGFSLCDYSLMPIFQHQRCMPERSLRIFFVSDARLQITQCQYTGTSNVWNKRHQSM